MLKIIWNKDDFERVKSKLDQEYHLYMTQDPNEVPVGKVGLILSEKNLHKLRPILEIIALEKTQVLLQTVSGWLQIHVQEIIYLEAFGDEIFMHTTTMSSQVIKQPLYQLEEILKPYHFARIGKSFIVNVSKIRYIRTAINAKLDLELINGTHLEVSRSFVKDFKNALGIQKRED
ncbi:LytTR family DNA-binding domain-containing protein [Peloplasma aerotolerans]|uniref:LytTR family DNA-binding domain-containing protein n=1 Tax=Peloplasma aerotolerans TaxID=3044389 RepID=A0AAW6U537_9MOLU|nr:LytTR family DNA-binding domain-containing protein [Mariniplasma sp. M4Ah]MDI6453007.1 LytTR family DNA-binding domain-containing protein [Mariniplasma sp. M4Ah]